MAILVCFHAHPDDEAVATAGTMAAAAAAGHRVVLVVATDGDQGEVPEGFLSAGERLADRRAAETRAATARVYEATVNRDHLRRAVKAGPALAGAPDLPGAPDVPDVDAMGLGVPEELLTTAVDVTPWLAAKRAAMRAHASQISEQSFFLALPDDAFAAAFGTEWFIRRGVPVPVEVLETTLLGELDP